MYIYISINLFFTTDTEGGAFIMPSIKGKRDINIWSLTHIVMGERPYILFWV